MPQENDQRELTRFGSDPTPQPDDTAARSHEEETESPPSRPRRSNPPSPGSTPLSAFTRSDTNPLEKLYADVRAVAADIYPDRVFSHPTTPDFTPDTKAYTTHELPGCAPALPGVVGNWTKAYATESRICYMYRGDAYDPDYGEGEAVRLAELYHNNRGYNRDGKYHLRERCMQVFTDPSEELDPTFEEDGIRLLKSGRARGGNGGVTTSTQARFEDLPSGVAGLIAILRTRPVPCHEQLPQESAAGWTIQQWNPRSVVWSAPLPEVSSNTTIELILTGPHCKIRITPSPNGHVTPPPVTPTAFDGLLESLKVDCEPTRAKYQTATAAAKATETILMTEPEHLIDVV